VQSCNRKTQLVIIEKQYSNALDSLEQKYYTLLNQYDDTTKYLKFELQIAQEKVNAADSRANAVQSAVEKIKSNTTTTVVVKGAEEVQDTTKK
jgi:hypothetical protein